MTEQEILNRIESIENRVKQKINNFFPIDIPGRGNSPGRTVEIEKLQFSRPDLFNLKNEVDLKDKGSSLTGSVKGVLVVKDKATGKVLQRSNPRTIVNIPYLTNRGTYIIGGKEKTISKQMRLKPGVYTLERNDKVTSLMFLQRGKNLHIEFDPEKVDLKVIIEKRTINAIVFFRILGISDQEIMRAINDEKIFAPLLRKAQSKNIDKVVNTLWHILPCRYFEDNEGGKYPGRNKAIQDIQKYFFNISEFGDTGKEVMNITLGHSSMNPDKQVFLKALSKVIKIAKADTPEEKAKIADDRDDTRFQNVLNDEDQIEFYVEKGLEKIQTDLRNRASEDNRSLVAAYNPSRASEPLTTFMKTGQLVDLVEQTNPLHMSAARRKITSLGEGGINIRAATQETRNIQNSAFGKLDPVETPESGKIGVVNHLTRNADVKNLTIYSKYYKVNNGSFKQIESNKVELDPIKEYNKHIAFYDPNTFKISGNTVTLPTKVWVRYQGDMIQVPRSKVDYVDISPNVIWGDATSLIPFSAHNDGNRMLMGANMQKQALPLENREVPLVQNALGPDRKKTFEEQVAEENAFTIRSDINGTVESVTKDKIKVKSNDGEIKEYKLMNYFPLNMSHYINNTPTVKAGDKIKKGDLLAEGWQTKNGTLALGTNTRVAYMPWKGYNFEDGFVISESYAQRMGTEELKEIRVEIPKGSIGGPGSGVKSILKRLNIPATALDKLNEDGIIKKNEKVETGTVLVGIVEEETELEEKPEFKMLRALGTEIQKQYTDKSYKIEGYIKGEVIDVKTIPQTGENLDYVIIVSILMKNPLKEGDKLAGRHGNKGIITKIEKDEDMPQAEDGKPVEMILSPLAVPSRKNLGQLYEANAGLIAEKTGKPFKVYNFDRSEVERVKKGLKEIGYPDGKMTLIDPETGKPFDHKVTVGNAYIMKLKHKVDDKLQARHLGKINRIYNMPVKSIGELAGEKENPQRWGEMEMRALQASKAVNMIDEAIQLKSDAAGDPKTRRDIFEALAFGGLHQYKQGVPETLKVFKDYSTALGINVKPLHNGKDVQTLDNKFNSLAILPLRDKEIRKLSRGEVTNDKSPFKSYVTGDQTERGGLFDPKIFGETETEKRSYWGHMNLAMPMPNPLLLKSDSNPYSPLLGINRTKLQSILQDKVGVIIDPGNTGLGKYEIVPIDKIEELQEDGKKFKYEVSGKAINTMLKEVNIDAELRKTQDAITEAKPKERPQLYKKLRILKMLKENDLKPEDLMIKSLPVLPVGLRPFEKDKNNRQTSDDMNTLYRDLLQNNNKVKELVEDPKKWEIRETNTKYNLLKDYYDRLENVMGVNTKPVLGPRGQEVKGIAKKMSGKDGLIRGRLMSKYLDYSGRSVITVNPSLELDEAGLPADIAVKLYKPFVMRELVARKGISRAEAVDKAENPNDSDTWEALQKVVKERPVVLNRAPSLHKYSIQAFTPKLTKARSIELNPLVVTGFNADFDGDQMGVHVPLTDEAVNEAKELLTPSKSLINPTNGQLIAPIKGEAILGLYYLTIDRYRGKHITKDMAKKRYMNYENLWREFKKGEIGAYDIVILDNKAATVGQHLVNHHLPEEYRDYRRILRQKTLSELIEEMLSPVNDDEKKNKDDTQAAVVALNKLKDIGFYAATRSGLSISVFDLKDNPNKQELIKGAEERIAKDPGTIVSEYKNIQEALEKETDKIFEETNPVSMFMTSGAKGKSDQVTRMSTMVGLSRDITGRILPTPIRSSHKEGLNPQEMWVHSYDSRRGLADRALSTAEPGALTRSLWSSTQDAIITTNDCGDTEGVYINKKDKSLVGRYLAQPVRDNKGAVVYRRGTMVDKKIRDSILDIKGLEGVYVRSPLTCKEPKGVCQKCYGSIPGTTSLPMIGEPVGILASQAIGEPTAQGTMKTFHGGGVSSGDEKKVTLGFDRVKELFNISKDPEHKSMLSPFDGTIVDVRKDVVNKIISIEHEENGKRKIKNIKVPLVKEIVVKPGDRVKKGDVLTEKGGALSPREIMEYKGLPEAQNYMVTELADVLEDNNIDRRHIELAVSKLTDKAQVVNSSASPWLPGQVTLRNQIEKWNEQNAGKKQSVDINDTLKIVGSRAGKTYKGYTGEVIVKEGEVITNEILGKLMTLRLKKIEVYPEKITYQPEMYGVTSNPLRGSENWFSQMGFQDIKEPFAEGAVFGKTDTLDEPRSRQMAGKLINVGSGFQTWKQEFNKLKDKIGGTLAGLFD